jgi:hypothetical protein
MVQREGEDVGSSSTMARRLLWSFIPAERCSLLIPLDTYSINIAAHYYRDYWLTSLGVRHSTIARVGLNSMAEGDEGEDLNPFAAAARAGQAARRGAAALPACSQQGLAYSVLGVVGTDTTAAAPLPKATALFSICLQCFSLHSSCLPLLS